MKRMVFQAAWQGFPITWAAMSGLRQFGAGSVEETVTRQL